VLRDKAYTATRINTQSTGCSFSVPTNDPYVIRWRTRVPAGTGPYVLCQIDLLGPGVYQMDFDAYAYVLSSLETVILNATYYFGRANSSNDVMLTQQAFLRDETLDHWSVLPVPGAVVFSVEANPTEEQEAVVSLVVSVPAGGSILVIKTET
jgi:hypothetical protein